jgi:hypothetical protein
MLIYTNNRKDTILKINESFHGCLDRFNLHHREEIIGGFGTWVEQHINDGWDGYLFTFMFNQLRGPQDSQRRQMHEEITAVYRKLVTRVVRKPNSPNNLDMLPRAVFFPDRPVTKKQQHRLRDVSVNDGFHMHGVLVSPSISRLKVGLDEHFQDNAALYKTPKLHRIDIRPITHSPDHVTQYAGKALRSWQFTEDDMLILPESMRERAQQAPLTDAEARRIRDIQSRFNVSDVVARTLVANRRLAR